MKRRIASLFLTLFMTSYACSYEPLVQSYCIGYGDPHAKIKVREYFSFSCPQCIRLFKQDFSAVKERYIEAKNVYWEFHPVPMDLLTVQAMVCLQNLNEQEKQMFLEAVLAESEDVPANIITMMMQKAMEIFRKPIGKLQDIDYVEKTVAFADAFKFLNQEKTVREVPTIEVDGEQFNEMPDMKLVDQIIERKLSLGSVQ